MRFFFLFFFFFLFNVECSLIGDHSDNDDHSEGDGDGGGDGDKFIIIEKKDFWSSTKNLFEIVIPSLRRVLVEELRGNFEIIQESKEELKLCFLMMVESASSSSIAITNVTLSISLAVLLLSLRIGKNVTIEARGFVLHLLSRIPASFTPSHLIKNILDEFRSPEERESLSIYFSAILNDLGFSHLIFNSIPFEGSISDDWEDIGIVDDIVTIDNSGSGSGSGSGSV